MTEIRDIEKFYDIVTNIDNYDFDNEALIYFKTKNGDLYYNLPLNTFLLRDKDTVYSISKMDGLNILNKELRRNKIIKLRNKMK